MKRQAHVWACMLPQRFQHFTRMESNSVAAHSTTVTNELTIANSFRSVCMYVYKHKSGELPQLLTMDYKTPWGGIRSLGTRCKFGLCWLVWLTTQIKALPKSQQNNDMFGVMKTALSKSIWGTPAHEGEDVDLTGSGKTGLLRSLVQDKTSNSKHRL